MDPSSRGEKNGNGMGIGGRSTACARHKTLYVFEQLRRAGARAGFPAGARASHTCRNCMHLFRNRGPPKRGMSDATSVPYF